MANVLDGKKLGQEVRAEVRAEVERLAGVSVVPGLAVVLVGHDPASATYVKNKTAAWLSKVRELRKNGVSLDEMVEEFQREVVSESGLSTEDFPKYARLSIRITLMGMLQYFQKNP